MIKRVSPEEVENFIKLYKAHGTFAEVARLTNRSPKTVSKYVNSNGSHKALVIAANKHIN